MELEAKIIDLLMAESEYLKERLNYLSEARLNKARDLCGQKYKEETSKRLLLCTTFIDKKQILRRCPELFNKLPFESKQKIDHFFKRVEKIRNQIAHSDSILTILETPKVFNKFLIDLQNINDVMDLLIDR